MATLKTNPQTLKNPSTHKAPLRAPTTERPKNRYAITIKKSPEEVFQFFRDFKNLPLFMKDLSNIEILSPTKSKWQITLESGYSTSWTAEITGEQPNAMISWQSVDPSEVTTNGSVWFSKAPADLGTVVELEMNFKVPGGKATEFATFLMGESPQILILTNLKRLKQLLETGEIATTKGQPSGREEDLPRSKLH